MPIQFTCPHCGAQTNVADQYAGQSGPCGQCGQTITIPGEPTGYTPQAPPKKSSSTAMTVILILVGVCGVLVVCGGILAALLLPAVQAAREAARRAQCTSHMKQIELALLNYESKYGEFPPAYIADANGKPMHSWRVLILPYLEMDYLYDQYNFDEPWDSPNNLAVSQMADRIFQCPSAVNNDGTKTNYVMVVGPGCFSEGATGRKMREITDGTSNTIMLVEIADSDIGWSEPRDLDASSMSYEVNCPTGQPCISSNHPGMANVGMADGSIHALDDGTDPEVVKRMTQVADGQPVQVPTY